MLLFKPEHVPLILGGTKTQTRRLGKRRWNIGAIHKAKTQMLSKEYFALLEILDVYQERLFDISDKDAIEEGYQGRIDYLRAFARINKLKVSLSNFEWAKNILVWVVKFRVADVLK